MSEEQVADAPVETGQATSVEPVKVDWRTEIPEEIRGHKSLETIQDVGSLAKSFVNAQSLIGADKVAIPGKYATDDDWSLVYDKMGRPADSSGYELQNKISEGQVENVELLTNYKDVAHKLGLQPKQAQGLLNWFNENNEKSLPDPNAMVVRQEETVNNLKREMGAAFDDNIALGNGVLSEFGTDDIVNLKMEDGSLFGDNPDVIRMMSKLGRFLKEKVGEDTLAGTKMSGAPTNDELTQKLRDIRRTDGPFWDAKHPEHSWYVDESLKIAEQLTQ
jgi:hypothetical protein|tara:strand:+ start:1876 stop:2703 length:828 start_codon:yes stop_codon:yes gene_type:complete